MARPTIYTEELGQEICARLTGGASLRDIARCRDMPAIGTMCAWIVEDRSGFYDLYIRARQCQAHVIADEISELIRALPEDIPEGQGAMPAVLARKYQLDNLRWYLTKMLPREFAEKPLLALDAIGSRAQVHIYLPGKPPATDHMHVIEGQAVEVLKDQSSD